MRRWALLVAGGAVWLILAAVPALADGGPHVLTNNNGSLGLNADGCAGCHRAHTAQGPFLINAANDEALCLTCHGAAVTGSTVDVMTGIQYTLDGAGLRSTTQLGALRGGGFDQARIGEPARLTYERVAGSFSQRPKVTVGPAEDVNSAHLALPENGLSNTGKAWGNGANGSGAGPTVALSCASCHNPHGNGKYRILNPIPHVSGTGFVDAAAPANVTDAALPPAGDTRNYTVIQTAGPAYLLLASQVTAGGYSPTAGDYFHRNVPWAVPGDLTTVGGGAIQSSDRPNGLASFNAEINAWCSTCHTRYAADQNPNPGGLPGPNGEPSPATANSWWFPRPGDDIFKYQHRTVSNRVCTTCHVSHGSNAAMTGTFSSTYTYPDGTVSASSRLLKVDNRGTCQMCHDPTNTTVTGNYTGPVPSPGLGVP